MVFLCQIDLPLFSRCQKVHSPEFGIVFFQPCQKLILCESESLFLSPSGPGKGSRSWPIQGGVQSGEDNCAEYRVSRDDLQQLRTEIKQVLDNRDKADEILPSVSGFFFGSTDYDEWYFGDLEHTLEFLNEALDTDRFSEYDFYYQASW